MDTKSQTKLVTHTRQILQPSGIRKWMETGKASNKRPTEHNFRGKGHWEKRTFQTGRGKQAQQTEFSCGIKKKNCTVAGFPRRCEFNSGGRTPLECSKQAMDCLGKVIVKAHLNNWSSYKAEHMTEKKNQTQFYPLVWIQMLWAGCKTIQFVKHQFMAIYGTNIHVTTGCIHGDSLDGNLPSKYL